MAVRTTDMGVTAVADPPALVAAMGTAVPVLEATTGRALR